MSCFSKFYKKEKLLSRTLEIDETLYCELEKLSKEVYDASINKLVNAAIEDIIEKENISLYNRKNTSYVARTFLIRNSVWESLYELKEKYAISIRLIINIAIRNALIEEGLIKEEIFNKNWLWAYLRILTNLVERFLLTNEEKKLKIKKVKTFYKIFKSKF